MWQDAAPLQKTRARNAVRAVCIRGDAERVEKLLERLVSFGRFKGELDFFCVGMVKEAVERVMFKPA